MKFIAIIPARYASTRFPGKPLAMLGGKTIIQRVYERVAGVVDKVVVATDDERIADNVRSFGGEVVMTGSHHRSGTDRCFEAYQKIGGAEDVVINVQGDEPFISPSQIELLKGCFADASTRIATLVKPFAPDAAYDTIANPNSPKVVVSRASFALYFSRSVIPYLRGTEQSLWPAAHTFYKHIGLYAFRADTLAEVTRLEQSTLETAESLEQLRWIENGYAIKVAVTHEETIGIDTPDDLKMAQECLKTTKNQA